MSPTSQEKTSHSYATYVARRLYEVCAAPLVWSRMSAKETVGEHAHMAASTSASPVGVKSPDPASEPITTPSVASSNRSGSKTDSTPYAGALTDFVCSYQTGPQEYRQVCGRPAVRLVSWPPETGWGTMTYCRMHFASIDNYLDQAVEVTDLVPEMC